MKRSRKGTGLEVDPLRVRQARRDAGLSLAEVAGQEVSRTFVHLVEQGKSRPSERVLELIARRTGKPVKYFLLSSSSADNQSSSVLAMQLIAMAATIRRFESKFPLTKPERSAMTLIEANLRQAAAFAKTLRRNPNE